MSLYFCGDKRVLWLEPGASAFLKKFSTNIPEAPRNAFVDLKGRIVAVFDQAVVSPDRSAIVIQGAFEDRLRKHLERYLVLEGVSLVAGQERVYFDLDGTSPMTPGALRIPQKKGAILITADRLNASVTGSEFDEFRLDHGIPLQGMDFDQEMLLCVGDEEYVSYTKGCFLGQEILARVHHLGRPPRRLEVREAAGQATDMTSRQKDPKTGRIRGFAWKEQAV